VRSLEKPDAVKKPLGRRKKNQNYILKGKKGKEFNRA
jgi:hypothetical protein